MISCKPLFLALDGRTEVPSQLVGGKGANLAELTGWGVPVPRALALTSHLFESFLAAQDDAFLDSLHGVGPDTPLDDLAAQCVVPPAVRSVIAEACHQLFRVPQRGQTLVAVRSSATCEDESRASFAGQFLTVLNCNGEAEVVNAVLRVWLSALLRRPREYAAAHNIDPETIRMAVVLQEQIDARAAGTAFSVCPETGAELIAIHASDGLGTFVVDGTVTPDTHVLDPDDFTIIYRRRGNKPQKQVYDSGLRRTVTRETTNRERQTYCLSPTTSLELAKMVSRIRSYFATRHRWRHVDVEFAVDDRHRIWITQARPETAWSNGKAGNSSMVDLSKIARMKILLEGGATGFPGVIVGRLRIVRSVSEAEQRVQPGDILVALSTTNVWELVLLIAGGAITDFGGTSAHTAIVMREQHKPCLVGADSATRRLAPYDNQMVTLDSVQRVVLLGSVPSDALIPAKPFGLTADTTATCLTDDEAWRSIPEGKTGKKLTDARGRRWIKKPGKRPVSRLMQTLYTESYRRMSQRLGIHVETRVEDGVHLVEFQGLRRWEEAMRGMSIDCLESLHEDRRRAIRAYRLASENLGTNVASLDAWLNAFINFNSFMSIAYTFSQVSELRYRNELAARRTPQQYAIRIETAMAARCGETEAARALRQYHALLQEAGHKARIRQSLRSAVESQCPRTLDGEFAERLQRYATEFKVTKHIDFTLTRDFAVMQVVHTLLWDIERNRQVHLPRKPVDQGEYYPGHDRFHRVAGLCFEAAKMRQDAHHQRVRGMWCFLDGLASMLPDLVPYAEGNGIEQVLDHTYQWLLDRISSCQDRPQDVVFESQCAP